MSTLAEILEGRVRAALHPTKVVVHDDSAAHAGHGASGAHVQLVIVSEAFRGKTPIERHRMVYGLFTEELKGPVHALQIVAKTPEEAEAT